MWLPRPSEAAIERGSEAGEERRVGGWVDGWVWVAWSIEVLAERRTSMAR